MNIDLFVTRQSEAGLVCEGHFPHALIGVILDAQTHEMILEFEGEEAPLHMNIPVEQSHRDKLLFAHRLYVGLFGQAMLQDAYEVPLFYLNDPYGSPFGEISPLSRPRRSVLAFNQFMKRCAFAQGVHRENLGDEGRARPVLHGVDLQALKFSPKLERQMQKDLAASMAAQTAPQMAGPGSSTAGAVIVQTHKKKKDDSDNSETK